MVLTMEATYVVCHRSTNFGSWHLALKLFPTRIGSIFSSVTDYLSITTIVFSLYPICFFFEIAVNLDRLFIYHKQQIINLSLWPAISTVIEPLYWPTYMSHLRHVFVSARAHWVFYKLRRLRFMKQTRKEKEKKAPQEWGMSRPCRPCR